MNEKSKSLFSKPFQIEENESHFFQLGPLQLWVEKKNDEWLIAENRLIEEKYIIINGEQKEKSKDCVWKRWVVNTHSNNIVFKAIMPNLPIVVRPENELKILPSEKALFYVLLPVWIQINVNSKNEKEKLLCEIPSIILSQTWFGMPSEGELAYSLKTSARRTLENVKIGVHQVVCPVNIHNNSSSNLDFNRLCLEAKHLSIYQGPNHLWSNEVNVTFRGEDHISQIKYLDVPPKNIKNTKLIGDPRIKMNKNFAKKSFDTFKSFTGF